MRHTKIVATIGPASDAPALLRRLIMAGVDVARLNFSHGTHEEQRARFQRIRAAAEELGVHLPIMLDTKGPEIRLGTFAAGKVELKCGQRFVLYADGRPGDEQGVSVSYGQLAADLQPGDRVLIDDGLLELRVVEVADRDLVCEVVVGGVVSDRKGVNVPGRSLQLPALSEQDRRDIRLGVELGCDFIAQSFVRSAADVLALRQLLEELAADIPIIAKIENQQGVLHLAEILKVADGLMVARGDMGVEIPAEEVPLIQKEMIAQANRHGKAVITATQMLDSMIRNPRPTRAEASDVANAILDGTDAVMLSGETANGRYPLEAVETMARIAVRTDRALKSQGLLPRPGEKKISITDAISHATVQAARDLGAAAIITATESGSTARRVSRYRPEAPIIAVTTSASVARRLNLYWGVHPIVGEKHRNTDEMLESSTAKALDAGLIKNGDLTVVTAGVPMGVPGTTNLLKVHIVGDVLARGMGIGSQPATGPVVVCKTAKEARGKEIKDGSILVAIGTDRDYVPLLEKAAGLVTEEGGLTSHAAVVALNLGLPVIVGVPGATSLLQDGQLVTLDTARGLIYRGAANIPAEK
ncbi:MAG: pyruvate kinase [Bacillota bacterium]